MKTKLRWIGAVLIVIGLIGFLTVADDLRHTGELFGVGSIMLAGLAMVVISLMLGEKVK